MKRLICIIQLTALMFPAITFTDEITDNLGGVGDVASTIKSDATREIEFLVNLIPDLMNDQPDVSAADNDVTDLAYHLELSFQYESDKRDFTGFTNSTHAYYGFHLMKYVNVGEDWIDSTNVYAFVYGHRYYGWENYQGFGYGWFAGGAYYETEDPYWWDSGGTVYSDVEESGISPVAALELFFKYQYKKLIIHPRILITIDKEFGEILFHPQLMIGAHF